jgi:hypothetical protein
MYISYRHIVLHALSSHAPSLLFRGAAADSSVPVISSSRSPLRTQRTTDDKRRTSIPSAGIETNIPAIKWSQTYAIDRKATGIGRLDYIIIIIMIMIMMIIIETDRPACERNAEYVMAYKTCRPPSPYNY